jgi:NADH-quinone oxidoreductase subunit H
MQTTKVVDDKPKSYNKNERPRFRWPRIPSPWETWQTTVLISLNTSLFIMAVIRAIIETEWFEKKWEITLYVITNFNYKIVIYSLLKIIFLLIAIAYFTIAERKVMGAIQRRKGPNIIGFWGLLQPLADGAKLTFKEVVIPTRATATIFLMAPIMVLTLSLISWTVIPSGLSEFSEISRPFLLQQFVPKDINLSSDQFTPELEVLEINLFTQSLTVDINYGVLFLLAVSGLNVYGIIIAGWASNSKYAFLGALRSAAQMISYEVSLGLLILPVVLFAGSLNLTEIVLAQERTLWFFFPLLPCSIIFFISMLAETNRAPFDLPEAEAELVAGYNVEYSSIIFAMFFLGEYSNMLLMGTVIVLFFFGGWLSPLKILNFIPGTIFFSLKTAFFCYFFILVRAALPRYRYDQLMNIGWKIFLPISLSYLVFVTGILITFDSLPQVLEIEPQVYTEVFFFTPETTHVIFNT